MELGRAVAGWHRCGRELLVADDRARRHDGLRLCGQRGAAQRHALGLQDAGRRRIAEGSAVDECDRDLAVWVLAAIHELASIARVRLAMGLSSAVPEQAGCRSPPAGGEVVHVD
jgi:hypothetical protein